MELPFSARVFSCIYITFIRLVIRGEIGVESAVMVAQGSGPLSSAVYCAFLKAVARCFLYPVKDIADNLPVHKVFGMHDRCSRHQMHGGADEIEVVTDSDDIRVRAVRPNDRIRESAVAVIA